MAKDIVDAFSNIDDTNDFCSSIRPLDQRQHQRQESVFHLCEIMRFRSSTSVPETSRQAFHFFDVFVSGRDGCTDFEALCDCKHYYHFYCFPELCLIIADSEIDFDDSDAMQTEVGS